MLRGLLTIVLRISLIAAICGLVWGVVQPRTQLMRIVRAALLLVCLLVVLVVLRLAGG
ncbi:MAG TPA: hypothetical protein VMX13_06340 [Sedimentisphaerales bacterium]|nr:hypothetical protein [Sedimentisphaerales bacterium]